MTVADRLERNSIPEPNSGCQLWLGAIDSSGQGRMKVDGKWVSPHRAAYAEKHGPIPPGLFLCHKCDVRLCINVDHVWPGSHQDNMDDMVKKGRSLRGARHWRSQLTSEQVEAIRSDRRTRREIGREYGVHHSRITAIKLGKSWKQRDPLMDKSEASQL